MFDRILNHTNKPVKQGFIWSLEGDHYLAFELDADGNTQHQADHAFKSFIQAKEWLQDRGVTNIQMEQSSAYFEMIGQDH
jgi:hypothetical protein